MCSSTKSEQEPIDTLGKVGRNAMGGSRVVDYVDGSTVIIRNHEGEFDE